ncbi:MAG TPA: MarR family winged helix-turn-helix transcriptional regulator [Microbacterium sp.]|nr:MarR family winged helix-turn-helix transcriptional regulator [Microbacterium sp.]
MPFRQHNVRSLIVQRIEGELRRHVHPVEHGRVDASLEQQVVKLLWLDPSQVVALVDDLQQRGLVAHEADENDRRAKVVVATAQGRRTRAAAAAAVRASEYEMLAPLSSAENAQLRELLLRLAFPA